MPDDGLARMRRETEGAQPVLYPTNRVLQGRLRIVEQDEVIEVVRVLRGGQDMGVEVEKT